MGEAEWVSCGRESSCRCIVNIVQSSHLLRVSGSSDGHCWSCSDMKVGVCRESKRISPFHNASIAGEMPAARAAVRGRSAISAGLRVAARTRRVRRATRRVGGRTACTPRDLAGRLALPRRRGRAPATPRELEGRCPLREPRGRAFDFHPTTHPRRSHAAPRAACSLAPPLHRAASPRVRPPGVPSVGRCASRPCVCDPRLRPTHRTMRASRVGGARVAARARVGGARVAAHAHVAGARVGGARVGGLRTPRRVRDPRSADNAQILRRPLLARTP